MPLSSCRFRPNAREVGYGFAVASRGLENVIDPLVVPGILGKAEGDDLGQWIGFVADAKPYADKNALHAAQLCAKGDFVAVAVQLFTLQPAPIYLVLVSRGPRL
jgi:hypothetical protein